MTGFNAQLGPILLRDVYVEEPRSRVLPRGGTARIYLHLFNQGTVDDALVRVTTPVAGSAVMRWDRDDDGRFDVVTSLPLPSGVPNWSPSPHSSKDKQLEPAAYYITLRRLTTELRPGETVPVTFVFAKAGSKAMRIPVELPLASRREPTNR